jgi:DNA-binding transcriptional regulator YiaG
MNEAVARKRVVRLQRTGALADLREAAGLDQTDVARALGVTQPTVWKWEANRMRPTGTHAVALLELLEAV